MYPLRKLSTDTTLPCPPLHCIAAVPDLHKLLWIHCNKSTLHTHTTPSPYLTALPSDYSHVNQQHIYPPAYSEFEAQRFIFEMYDSDDSNTSDNGNLELACEEDEGIHWEMMNYR